MLAAIAIVPSAPVLVPELAGAAAVELDDLRAAMITAARALPQRWVAIGAADRTAEFDPECTGTFAGFGVDLPVGLSPAASNPTVLPLAALMAGWLRGQAQPTAQVRVRVYAEPDDAAARGAELRAELDRTPNPFGVLVLADGANTLTKPAPGGYHPEDATVQSALDAALAGGDTAALTGLPAQVVGRVAFAVLAGLTDPPGETTEFYRGAPYGVGYFAGLWRP